MKDLHKGMKIGASVMPYWVKPLPMMPTSNMDASLWSVCSNPSSALSCLEKQWSRTQIYTERTWKKLLLLVSAWPSPCYCCYLDSEPEGKMRVCVHACACLSLLLSVILSNKYFKENLKAKKQRTLALLK